MSVFGKILEKLGLRKDKPATSGTQAQTTRTPQSSSPGARGTTTASTGAAGGAAASTTAGQSPRTQAPPSTQPSRPAAPAPMSETDVVAKLEKLAADNPQKLNWRTSIVDLMKLLGMESSLAERKELAEELGYPREQMDDTAKMNVWLHKQVLRKIAENGGNVPKELLD